MTAGLRSYGRGMKAEGHDAHEAHCRRSMTAGLRSLGYGQGMKAEGYCVHWCMTEGYCRCMTDGLQTVGRAGTQLLDVRIAVRIGPARFSGCSLISMGDGGWWLLVSLASHAVQ